MQETLQGKMLTCHDYPCYCSRETTYTIRISVFHEHDTQNVHTVDMAQSKQKVYDT